MIHTKTLAALAAAGVMLTSPLAYARTAGAANIDERDVVVDARGNVVVNSFGNCVRTQWLANGDACGQTAQATTTRIAPRRLAEIDRTVYFQFDKYALTEESRNKLNSLADVLKSDQQVRSAKIVGYADRIGSRAYNDRLSQRRANAVKDYLTKRGYINTRVTETRWLGETAPVTHCSDDMSRPQLIACLQQDRRVEVEIDYYPEGQAPAQR